jgi:4-amino-4-deoxy-L-arabinose transferase-like glycosyltransferase
MNANETTATMRNHSWMIIAILITAFILRTAWVLSIPTQPISDFKEFDRLAVRIVDGKGYVSLDGRPTAYRPPGYIFFLAGIYSLFGHNDLIVRLGNVLLGVLTCWLTYILTIELFDKRTAVIATLMIAAFPSLIVWTNILATENLFIPIVLGIIITFLKAVKFQTVHWYWLIPSGIFIGLAVLIRPAALLLPGILILALILRTRFRFFSTEGMKLLGTYAVIGLVLNLVMFATILPWSIRNTVIFGRFVLVSTEGGITFLSGHNERALLDEYSLDGPIFDSLNAEKLDEISYDRRAYQLAFQFIRQNPLFEVRLIIHKFINFFKDDVSGITYNVRSALTPIPDWFGFASKGLAQIYYVVVMGLALASILLKRYPLDRWYIIQLLFILVWVFLHLAFYGKDRFRIPLMPAFAQFAAVSLLALWDRRSIFFYRKVLPPII